MSDKLITAYKNFMDNGVYGRACDCLYHLWNRYGRNVYLYIENFRQVVAEKAAKGENTIENMALLKKAYMLTAKEYFKDYLVAVEWNKPYKDKFYLPRKGYLDKIVDGYQQILDGDLKLLTISMPKRAGKSQLGINFVNMISGKYPDRSSLMEGAGDALIESFYNGCLEYLQPESLYSYYEIFPEAKVVQTKYDLHIINLNERNRFPTIMCRSIDSAQVGLSEATNVLYLDDCVQGREEAKNRKRLDDKWESISGDVIGRALEGTPIVATGTRYSLYDPIGRLQERAKELGWKWKSIEIPALDPITDESNYEFYNPKLERQMFTTEFFRGERKTLTAEQFESEFQQQPFEAKGLLFPEKELNRFFELPVDKEPDGIVAVCDTAEGGGDSTMMPIAYLYGEDVFIVDVVFDNSPPSVTKAECANKIIEHKVGNATFESNLAGTYFARDVESLVKELGGKCSIRTKRTISNKQTRIELASANILQHFFFLDKSLYKQNSQYGQMMKELTTYTRAGKVAHDDAPDGMSLLENELRTVLGNTVEVVKRFF